MPEFTYIGPHDGVDVDFQSVPVGQGTKVTVDTGVAKSLRGQPDNWRETKTKNKES